MWSQAGPNLTIEPGQLISEADAAPGQASTGERTSMKRIDGHGLNGVSETTLWTLHNRATEAARPDGVLTDPLAVELLHAIDYPYREHFGRPSQSHALRALMVDTQIREFLAAHPDGVVVSLGEGLQTTFWRIASPTLRYLAVDLPTVIELRQRLLPDEPRLRHLARSALDREWMDEVEGEVLIVAEGLLMYFEPREARRLIADCAARFPGGRMLFDSISPLVRRLVGERRLTPAYTTPPMPFTLRASQARALPRHLPAVATATDVPWLPARGGSAVFTLLAKVPVLGDQRPIMTLLRFAER